MNDSSTRSPGRRLREARERRNIPASRVAEQLRLEPQLMEAIESDRWEELGASVYARGHIRKYAEIVGLPAEELLGAFNELGRGPGTPSLIPAASARDLSTSRRRNPMPYYAAAALVVVLGGLYWWFALDPSGTQHESAARSPAELLRDVTHAMDATPPARETPAEAVPATEAAPTPVTAVDGAVTVEHGPAPDAAAPTSTVVAAAPVVLDARFRGQSWFEVYDATGERRTFELVPAGARRQLQVRPPLRVLLGNASAVTLSIGGKAARVPPQLVVADTAWVQIDADGVISAAAPRRVGSGSE